MAELNEKLIKSEPVFRGILVNLDVDTVELPDGQQARREIVRHPGAVAIVPLLPTGEVALVKQFRAAVRDVLIEIPAGTLEPGEDPLVAAERELQEEIGYKPAALVWLGSEYTAPGYTSELIHIYLATGLTPSRLAQDSDEFLEVVTMPLEVAVAQVERGEMRDGKTIIGLLLAARYLSR